MSDQESSRREFMKKAGIVVGGTLIASDLAASSSNKDAVRKLNPEQNEFMERYGKWMDDFTEVIKLQKKEPYNEEFRARMEVLTQRSQDFKPELSRHMKDKTFNLIYLESIKRVKYEI